MKTHPRGSKTERLNPLPRLHALTCASLADLCESQTKLASGRYLSQWQEMAEADMVQKQKKKERIEAGGVTHGSYTRSKSTLQAEKESGLAAITP